MLMLVAIVEDEKSAADRLREYLLQYQQKNECAFDISWFRDAESFLEQYNPVFSVVFMDIKLRDMDGLEAAQKLRTIDDSVPLVFVTSMAKLASRGYEVDAIGFLVKPVSYADLAMKLDHALNRCAYNSEYTIAVKCANGMFHTSYKKLMYVEISGHTLIFHMVDRKVEIRGTISSVAKLLEPYGFIRCNHCYLVNYRFIRMIKNNSVWVGRDTELVISQSKRKAFLASYGELAGAKGGDI